MLARPTGCRSHDRTQHDDRARQLYVLALNRYVQTTLADGSRLVCANAGVTRTGAAADAVMRPAAAAPAHGAAATAPILAGHDADLAGPAVARLRGSCRSSARRAHCRLSSAAGSTGSLRLDPELVLPRYQAAVDNHSFPGGYHAETRADDVRQGAVYSLSASVYLLEQTGAKHDYRGQTLIGHILGRFPGLRPRRILDLGCLCGASTAAYCEQFPDAEIHALDTSAPALRFAHGLARARPRDSFLAAECGVHRFSGWLLRPGRFACAVPRDIYAAFPRILAECHRVLGPGASPPTSKCPRGSK